MESLSGEMNTLKNQIDNPDISFYGYLSMDNNSYSNSIRYLREAVLLRELAELRLKNAIRDYLLRG